MLNIAAKLVIVCHSSLNAHCLLAAYSEQQYNTTARKNTVM